MSRMPFDKIGITAFRGLRDLTLEGCGPVNLLVGENNSGKTTVLEAMLLLANPRDISQWESAIAIRGAWPLADYRFRGGGIDRIDSLCWLFPHEGDDILPISLSGGPVEYFSATAERIVGDPPERPVHGPDELIEGGFRPVGRRPKEEQEAMPEPGLVIELDSPWTGSTQLELDRGSGRFRMVLWERGRTFRARRKEIPPAVPNIFGTPISHRSDGYLASRVGRLLRTKRKEQAVSLVRALDPNVNDLVMVSPEHTEYEGTIAGRSIRASLHVDHAQAGLVPIHAMGDGIRRAIHFAALIADVGREGGGIFLSGLIRIGNGFSRIVSKGPKRHKVFSKNNRTVVPGG